MLPTPQNFASTSSPAPHPSSYPSLGGPVVFSNQPSYLSQTVQDHFHQGADPNSPEFFKQHIFLIRDNVAQLQNLARNALSGIQNAYHTGNNPAQTEANITALNQTLQMISNMLRGSGVGALPLLPTTGLEAHVVVPTEQQLLLDTNQSIHALYERLKRSQDSAAVVANLLGAPDPTATRGNR